ncbi:MAG: ThiF family adenylyltransferase [Verrucomicrobiales bacterium]|nr:ThiF family adenylyltransferase [Verrucomicrobiales bacterium]
MKILICGAGALGSHFAYLARDLGADLELSVIDFDRVETKNLASQWFVKQMVGKNKATALKMQWQNFYGLRLKDYTVRLTGENVATILGDQDLVIDCFDNAESRQLIQGFVRENGIACLHGGLAADGEYGVVRWDSDFVIDSEDVPGQATCEGGGFLPVILAVSGALTAAVLNYQKDNSHRENWNLTPRGAEAF